MSSLLVRRLLIAGESSCLYGCVLNSRCWQRTNVKVATKAKSVSDQPKVGLKIVVPVFKKAIKYDQKIALHDHLGDYTYSGIVKASDKFADVIRRKLDGKIQERVAFLCPNDASYIIAKWGSWISGQIGVPLSIHHPLNLLEYFVTDSDANLLVTTNENIQLMEELSARTGVKLVVLEDELRCAALKHVPVEGDEMPEGGEKSAVEGEKPSAAPAKSAATIQCKTSVDTSPPLTSVGLDAAFYSSKNALIIYTSGTTGGPKGVVLSHRNLYTQVCSMLEAWGWTDKDAILHTLPLVHVHGIVNALMCPLAVGARCVMLPSFDAAKVWTHLLGLKLATNEKVNLFMGVPTMYSKLLTEYHKSLKKNERISEYVKASCTQNIRLMVCGSAPMPLTLFEQWEQITGHALLERYGMSETGMVLSNPLEGKRIAGSVGSPLPGVQVRVEGAENDMKLTVGSKAAISGELLVKGDSVFKEYWRKQNATQRSFTADGWFKTGDRVQCHGDGTYSIMGRESVDIIKSGGYKISALNVESVLLNHPDIVDVAVVGLPDITWGQKVTAVVALAVGVEDLKLSDLKEFAKEQLADYSVPTVLKIVPAIPRNQMGKVNKKELIDTMFPELTK